MNLYLLTSTDDWYYFVFLSDSRNISSDSNKKYIFIPLGRYLLALSTLNRYLHRGSNTYYFITTCYYQCIYCHTWVSLGTIPLLDFVTNNFRNESYLGKTQIKQLIFTYRYPCKYKVMVNFTSVTLVRLMMLIYPSIYIYGNGYNPTWPTIYSNIFVNVFSKNIFLDCR